MRARLSSRSRRLALGGLVVMLLPVGVAHLAENSVPVTYAGVAEQPITIQTSFVLQDAKVNIAQADYYHFTNLAATLTYNEGPVQGATIVFEVAGIPVCTGETNNRGFLNCAPDTDPPRSDFPDGDPAKFTFVAVVSGGPLDGLSSAPAQLEKDTGGGVDFTGQGGDHGNKPEDGSNNGNSGANDGSS